MGRGNSNPFAVATAVCGESPRAGAGSGCNNPFARQQTSSGVCESPRAHAAAGGLGGSHPFSFASPLSRCSSLPLHLQPGGSRGSSPFLARSPLLAPAALMCPPLPTPPPLAMLPPALRPPAFLLRPVVSPTPAAGSGAAPAGVRQSGMFPAACIRTFGPRLAASLAPLAVSPEVVVATFGPLLAANLQAAALPLGPFPEAVVATILAPGLVVPCTVSMDGAVAVKAMDPADIACGACAHGSDCIVEDGNLQL